MSFVSVKITFHLHDIMPNPIMNWWKKKWMKRSVVVAVLILPVFIFAAISSINRAPESLVTPMLIDATTEYNPAPNVVFVSENVGYMFFVGGSSYSTQLYGIMYNKTTDGGETWVRQRVIPSPSIEQWGNVSVWYDQWTPGDSGTKIHIAAIEAVTDDVWYNTLDTDDDSYDEDGWVSAIAGTAYNSLTDGGVGITKSTDENLFISGCGTFGSAKCAVYKSSDGDGDSWSNTSFNTATATDNLDQLQILPISGGDILAIMQDMSANNVISLEYDEATDGWGNKQTVDSSESRIKADIESDLDEVDKMLAKRKKIK